MADIASQKLRIGIVGGGIGGLSLAVWMSKLNVLEFVQVDVYESASELTQVGAGITVWPRGWEILQSMGLEASLAARFSPDQTIPDMNTPKLGFVYRKSDHKEGVLIEEVKIPGGSLSFHRADVQEALLEHLSPSIQFHLSHRLKGYRHSKSGVELEFRNGAIAMCDILVGADGINSAVRRTFLAEGKYWSEEEKTRNSRPLWTGTNVYRNLIDSELIRGEMADHRALKEPMVYCGKNKHVVSYPVSQGKLLNVVWFVSDLDREGTNVQGPAVIENTTDDYARHFAGWEEEVAILLKHCAEKSSRWAIQTLKPLDTYASGRVVLLGDAAHAMAPHLGNGAGQAMEVRRAQRKENSGPFAQVKKQQHKDAYILAHIISETLRTHKEKPSSVKEKINIPRLLNIYSSIRQPFGNFAVVCTRNQGLVYEFNAPGCEDIKDGEDVPRERLERIAEAMRKNWEWTWQSPSADLRRALAMI